MKNLKILQQAYISSSSAADRRKFYKAVYELYFNKVYAFTIAKNRKDAKDITADVFERLIKRDPASLQLETLEAYLFSIAKNLGTDYHRRNSRRSTLPITSELDNFLGLSVDPKTKKEFMLDFERAMARLSPRQHQAISLQLSGYSQADIAKQLATTSAAVRSLLQHSRAKLRMHLKNWRH